MSIVDDVAGAVAGAEGRHDWKWMVAPMDALSPLVRCASCGCWESAKMSHGWLAEDDTMGAVVWELQDGQRL